METNPFPYYISRIVSRDIYGEKFNFDVGAPNVERAFFTDSSRTEIAIQFVGDQDVIWQSKFSFAGKTFFLKDYFSIDDPNTKIVLGRASGGRVYLRLSNATTGGRSPIYRINSILVPSGPIKGPGSWEQMD